MTNMELINPMAIYTQEALERLFKISRERQLKKMQLQLQKYRKAQETIKKELANKLSKTKDKTSQEVWKQPQTQLSRVIQIYNTKYTERFADDNKLYTSRNELKEAEKRGEGKIRWDVWDNLVNKTKKLISSSPIR